MTSDERTLIFSLIFSILLILVGALRYSKKNNTTLKDTLIMIWRECFVDGFKELRKNFIPVTKTILGKIWEYAKKKAPKTIEKIVKFFHLDPKPVKLDYCTIVLYLSLQDALSGYAYTPFPIEVSSAYLEQPPHIDVSLYTKSAVTNNDRDAIAWVVSATFKRYMRIFYRLNCPCFAVPYVLHNHIKVVLYYCILPEDYPAYTNMRNQIMRMFAAPVFKPLTEADLPKTSGIVLGYSYEKWTTTGQVDPILWDVAKAPHAMVSGSTGGGKSVYIKILLAQLLEAGASVCVCDYKGQNDYRGLVKDIATGADCDARLTRFCADFEKARELGEDKEWKILVFDEFGSYVASKSKKEREELMGAISNVVFMGRSYKCTIVLVSQRFDAETIKTSLREQFGVKVHMGETISKEAATMLFPNSDVDKSQRLPLCCGRISTPKTDYDIITVPKVDIPALDRRIKELGDNAL